MEQRNEKNVLCPNVINLVSGFTEISRSLFIGSYNNKFNKLKHHNQTANN